MPDSPLSIAALRLLVAGGTRPQADLRPPDAWRRSGLARAQLHEVYAAEVEDGPAAIGFAAALVLAAEALPVLWLRTEHDQATAGGLHAVGLAELGMPPDALLMAIVPSQDAALRAAVDAARCAGLGTLLMESRGHATNLDLTATRRLMLAGEESGVIVLSVRIGAAPTPSAAATRWRVAACPSTALAAGAPGRPAFDVECLRRRGGQAGTRERVEWNRDDRCFDDPYPASSGVGHPDRAPLAGAGLSLAAGGSAPRRPAAPVRRTW